MTTGTHPSRHTTHQVLVGESEHSGHVLADVCYCEQCQRNAKRSVDDCGESADCCLGRDVTVACVNHTHTHTHTHTQLHSAAAAAADDDDTQLAVLLGRVHSSAKAKQS